MMQVPGATMVTVLPFIVQTGWVVELNVTARPDDAVAPTVNGASPNVFAANAPNVIVCAALAIVTDSTTTSGAGL